MVMAVAEAQAGEYDSAIERFDQLMTIPSPLSVEMLKAISLPDELKQDPRFTAILDRGDKVF